MSENKATTIRCFAVKNKFKVLSNSGKEQRTFKVKVLTHWISQTNRFVSDCLVVISSMQGLVLIFMTTKQVVMQFHRPH